MSLFHRAHRFPHLTWLLPLIAGGITFLIALSQRCAEPACSILPPALAGGAVILSALIVIGLRLFLYFHDHEVVAAAWIPFAFATMCSALLGGLMAYAVTGIEVSTSMSELGGGGDDLLTLWGMLLLGGALAVLYVLLEKRRLSFRPAVILGLVLLGIAFLAPMFTGVLLGGVVQREYAFVDAHLADMTAGQCQEMRGSSARDMCFTSVARRTGDASLCKYDAIYLRQPYCVTDVAREKKEYAICGSIPLTPGTWQFGPANLRNMERLACYASVAIARGDERVPCATLFPTEPSFAQDCIEITSYLIRNQL